MIEWTPAEAYADTASPQQPAPWLITDLAAAEPDRPGLSPVSASAPYAPVDWSEQTGVRGLWRLGGGLSWQVEVHKTVEGSPGGEASPVATIQCERGWLGTSSVTGRNCRVTDFERSHAAMTGLWSPLPGLQTELGMFRHSESRVLPAYLGSDTFGGRMASFNDMRMLSGEYLGRDYAGVDLGLRFEFPASAVGRFAVDADVARILEYSVDTRPSPGPLEGSAQGSLAGRDRDFARLQFDWSRGSFSGGIESLYREVVPFDVTQTENSEWTSFNVHFTWRTPWNGALSLGATNLLDDSPEESRGTDSQGDAFDSIYGRIPYVRYKQDL